VFGSNGYTKAPQSDAALYGLSY